MWLQIGKEFCRVEGGEEGKHSIVQGQRERRRFTKLIHALAVYNRLNRAEREIEIVRGVWWIYYFPGFFGGACVFGVKYL